MKKLLLTILMLFVCSSCYATDYWVYVRLEDRFGVDDKKTAGKSKKGDIVDIRIADYEPSESEKREWGIIKVSGLTEEQIIAYKEPLLDKDKNVVAYRKQKIDATSLGIKVGYDSKIAPSLTTIQSNISEKTELDLSYYKIGTVLYALSNPVRQLLNRNNAYAATTSSVNWSGQDYDTITLWEDAKDGDGDTTQTIECYDDDGVLDDAVTIAGWADSSVITITAPDGERHNGTSSSGFTLRSSVFSGIIIDDNNITVTISWLIIREPNNSTSYQEMIGSSGDGGWTFYFYNNILEAKSQSSSNYGSDGIYVIGNGTVYIYNNIIYGFDATASDGIIVSKNTFGTVNAYVYNNTISDCLTGYNFGNDVNGTVNATVKNNIAQSCTTDYASTIDTSSNNIDEDGSGEITSTLTFNNAAGYDFHLASTDTDAIDAGADLSGTFTTDIDGTTRTGTWDIGADEYVSSVTAPTRYNFYFR